MLGYRRQFDSDNFSRTAQTGRDRIDGSQGGRRRGDCRRCDTDTLAGVTVGCAQCFETICGATGAADIRPACSYPSAGRIC